MLRAACLAEIPRALSVVAVGGRAAALKIDFEESRREQDVIAAALPLDYRWGRHVVGKERGGQEDQQGTQAHSGEQAKKHVVFFSRAGWVYKILSLVTRLSYPCRRPFSGRFRSTGPRQPAEQNLESPQWSETGD